MSPVDRAGPVSEISPHSYFLCKNCGCVHMRRRASPVTEISVSTTEISATGMKIFPYEHSSPVTGMKMFLTN